MGYVGRAHCNGSTALIVSNRLFPARVDMILGTRVAIIELSKTWYAFNDKRRGATLCTEEDCGLFPVKDSASASRGRCYPRTLRTAYLAGFSIACNVNG